MRDTINAVIGGRLDYEDGLDALSVAPAGDADPVLEAAFLDACARLWRGGWLPAELHRLVTRRGSAAQADLVLDAAGAYLRGFPAASVDPRWADGADTTVWWTGGYPTALARRRRLDRVSVLDQLLGLVVLLAAVPKVETLVPAPGAARAVGKPRAAGAGADRRMLDRVRALLAKAESTTFAAEAETYTAKAQELITRHSIDEALLAARDPDPTVLPLARRIGVDSPYESEKASLLHAVARANRCHTVWSSDLGFVTVFGFDSDIDAVDLLYTSLLVQAGTAMARNEPRSGRAKIKTFRQSFLVAFAIRIGERLTDAERRELARDEAADALPVLASRDERVRETMNTVFPRTVRTRGSRVDSAEGWSSGREAANQAALP